MFSKTWWFCAAGAIAQLVVPSALIAQAVAHNGQVLTPFGYRDSAKVHPVRRGYNLNCMEDGHIRMENAKTGDHIDFPKPQTSVNPNTIPFSDNGWVTFASWYSSYRQPISYFATDWTVPAAPAYYNGQTLFQFNSIEPASGNAILQPVLQYGPSAAGGGEYWGIASWYVVGDQAYFSELEAVNPGQPVDGVVELIARAKNRYSYSCEFYGYGYSTIIVTGIPKLVWCTETLEVYGVSLCSQFPNTFYSPMNYINVRLTGEQVPVVNWSITDAQTACSVQSTVVVNGAVNAWVNIYY
jgi:hypothetical protein